MELFVIQAHWKLTRHGETFEGIAVCSDPDTPVTFITSDGLPVVAKNVWNYILLHHRPWAKF